MTDITEIDTKYNLSNLISNYDSIKYNPAGIIGAVLEYLNNVTQNKVSLVDPTNPLVMLLESSAVNTAAAITEANFLLRKQYPILAETEEELYRHMSDKDYLDRFSTPSRAMFNFVIEYNSLVRNAVRVEGENYSKVTIARNTNIYIEDIPFSIQYPIDIRLYDSGKVMVLYDTKVKSPLLSLSTNIIQSSVVRAIDGTKCVMFSIEAKQFSIKSICSAVDLSTPFTLNIPFTDKFYYCRVYYKTGNKNNEWVEIKTTHSEQVYDTNKPTAILQVMSNSLKVSLPIYYTDTKMVSGNVRIDIYTTKGALTLNLSDYKISAFSAKLIAIDEIHDVSKFTTAMNSVNFYINSTDTITGGYNGLTFEQLKDRVINNSIGDPNIPITNVQLEDSKMVEGFEISKNIDSVTNRIYVVSKSLPQPINDKLITAANITMMSLTSNINTLKMTKGCYDNGLRLTLSTDVYYKDNNGELMLIDEDEINNVKSLSGLDIVDHVNSNNYYFTPFHYVLDSTTSTFKIRSYYLDNPYMHKVNFIEQNMTMEAVVNTKAYSITKSKTGYELLILTTSDEQYKSIPISSLGMVVSFIPTGETTPVYVKGNFIKKSTAGDSNGEYVFGIKLESTFDIDEHDNIYIKDLSLNENTKVTIPVPLDAEMTIYYCTNAIPVNYKTSVMDGEFPKWMYDTTADGWLPITKESIQIHFGDRLHNLWTQTKSVYSDSNYEKYSEDVPLTYTEDVYETDENGLIKITTNEEGQLSYNLLHHKGDIVYDDDGEIIYKYRAGDYKLDENNNPIPLSEEYIKRIMDILLIEGSYLFTTDKVYRSYIDDELVSTIVNWITDDLASINNNLLEQTHIYYRPKLMLGNVDVNVGNDNILSIEAEQSLEVTLYVEDNVYNDSILKDELERKIINTINSDLTNSKITIYDLTEHIKEVCGNSIITLYVTGLGGKDNYQILSLENDYDKLCLKKKLVLQNDGSIIVSEDVTFKYVKYTNNPLK